MNISRQMAQYLEGGSLIRKLFEEGASMKNDGSGLPVYDFSLGNPSLSAPEQFYDALKAYSASPPVHAHSYMPNAGLEQTRCAVAQSLCEDHRAAFRAEHILMTVGAAGAINTALKAILDMGDEVVVQAPFFVEYGYYVANHGGRLVTVDSLPDFHLNVNAIAAAISTRTKAVMITNPNNPTGTMYTQSELNQLGKVLSEASARLGHVIYLIDDAPYRKLVYDVPKCTSSFDAYSNTLMATSHSKDLSLPGERIGFLALGPNMQYLPQMIGACAFASRILGYVNAPALMQYLAADLQKVTVDLNWYRRRRNRLYQALVEMGYQVSKPDGAFYLFPRVPWGDDHSFTEELKKNRILVVPGSGFGKSGYFRIAYCVCEITIEESLPIFKKAMTK